MHVLFNVPHFPVPHGTDAVLWIITIHHKYVISVQVMEITGEQYGERGFPTPPFWLLKATNKGSLFIGLNLECIICFISVRIFCFITRQCIRWYMAMTHCLPVCMNTLHTILHQCNTGCRWALPYKVHCIHAIWGSMYPILHCTDAMYSVMQNCRAAYMALHIYG